MNTVETKKIGDYQYDIMTDDEPESPRDWDNLGTMVCFHRRYNLGDKHDFDNPDDFRKFIKNNRKIGIVLPLYLYDHGGITMNTTGFGCPWDSGQVGWIYISKEKMRSEYGYKRISKKLIERVRQYLINEVGTYDQYLMGEIYGFRITKDDEEVDSCWGYYGLDECRSEVESIIQHLMKSDEQGQLQLDLKE
jgi:hypothetical protein